jgi:electron transfer flavoprotein beta subunit
MDSNGLQSILAQEISSGGYDVVYCGKSAADTGAGSTGPGLAERLGWCSVSNITDISFENGLTVTSPSEGGNAVIAVSLPAVVSCDKGSTKVRKSNVKGIMMAKRAQVDVKSVTAPASSVTIVSQVLPPAKPAGKKFEGGESAQTVAQLLRDEANII